VHFPLALILGRDTSDAGGAAAGRSETMASYTAIVGTWNLCLGRGSPRCSHWQPGLGALLDPGRQDTRRTLRAGPVSHGHYETWEEQVGATVYSHHAALGPVLGRLLVGQAPARLAIQWGSQGLNNLFGQILHSSLAAPLAADKRSPALDGWTGGSPTIARRACVRS